MRRTLTYVWSLLCLCFVSTTAMAQNGQYDVRFAIKNFNCATDSVTIQVQVKAHDAAHTFRMGDANYRFDYDPRVISNPSIVSQENFSNQAPANNFHYNAQTLNGSSAGLTLGTVSLNTIYGSGGNDAQLVPIDWVTVSCIRFKMADPTKCINLTWHDNNRFPITGMNEVVLLGGGAYDLYDVAAGGIFGNYSQCIPSVCNSILALNDVNVTLKNTAVLGNLLTNDISTTAMTATTTALTSPNSGVLAIAANGNYTYTPVSGFVGKDSAQYIVCNAASQCDTAWLFVDVIDTPVGGVNSAPIALNDNGVTPLNTPLTSSVLTNDMDPEGNTLTVNTTPLKAPTNGTLVLSANGTYVYTPSNSFYGQDTFRYAVCDNGVPSLCDTAEVVINVTVPNTGGGGNLAPTPMDDNYLTYKNTTVSGNLKPNDSDPNAGQTLTYNTTATVAPTHGTVTINANGTFTYVPTTGYLGSDFFTYTVCDNGSPVLCADATANIVITTAPNLAPDVTVTPQIVGEDTVKTFCLPIVDPNTLDTHTVTACTPSTVGGTATAVVNNTTHELCVTYQSAPNFNGQDTVCFIVCDNGVPSKCDTVKVPITVTPINDKPIVTVTPVTIKEDSIPTFCLPITDPDAGQTFTATPCFTANGTTTATIVGNTVCITYTPNLNYNGLDTACVIVCDNGSPSKCDTVKVPITITPVNDKPVITVVTPKTTVEDSTIIICTTITDPDGGSPVFAATICGVQHGTATPSVVGNQLCITYTPTLNYNGPDTLCIVVCDNGTPSLCDTIKVPVTVTPVNDKPVVTVTPVTIVEDSIPTFCLPITDPDAGQTFTATPCFTANGTTTATIVGNTVCITYTPNLNYNGLDTACVIVCDNGSPSKCDTVKVPITITPVNDKPVITVVTPKTTVEDSTIIICTTITDPDGGTPVFAATLCGVQHGTATPSVIGNQLCITYTPTLNYFGADTVCVIVCDNGVPSKCDTLKVPIVVTQVNDKPVVTVTPITIAEDSVVTFCMPITDPDAGQTFASTLCGVGHGTATTAIVGNTVCVTYTPTLNYNGADTICVIVCDNGTPSKCDTVKVPITLTPVNDKPVITVVTPKTTVEDSTIIVCTTITDPDGGTPVFTPSVCGVQHGTATPSVVGNQLCITYTPTLNYTGPDTLCIVVCDNGVPSKCDTIKVPVTVTPVNDKPVVTVTPVTVKEDTAVATFCLPITDPDAGQSFTATPCGIGHGTISTVISAGQLCISYTPAANYFGQDTACVIVCDNGTPSKCDTVKVPITVTPVNDKPIIPDGTVSTPNTTPATLCIPITDVDPTDTHTYSTCSTPTKGTVNAIVNNATHQLCLTYTPTAGAVGSDIVCVIICDNGSPSKCDTAYLTFVLGSTNDKPVATNDINATVKNTAVSGNVLTNDSDPNNHVLTVNTTPVQSPTNGVITLNANGTYTYTPVANFVGTDIIKYQVCDNGVPSLCDTATLVIEVREVAPTGNQAPIAADDNTSTPAGQTIIVAVKANDFDPQGGTIGNPTLFGTPVGGTPSVNPNGTVTFVPAPGFVGDATFTYFVCDNGTPSLCDSATATIVVYPNPNQGNIAPVAIDDAFPVTQNTTFSGTVATNDYDQNAGQILSFTQLTSTVNGAATLLSNGQVSYVPATGFVGVDSFKYKVCDNGTPSLCDTAVVVFNIPAARPQPTNIAPVATNDVTTTLVNTAITIPVKTNDYDPNGGQALTNPTIVGTPVGGTAIVNPDGTVTFTPTTGFTGAASFTYQVCDNGTPVLCDNATVTVNVVPTPALTNRPPVAGNDAGTTPVNTILNSTVATNDSDPDAGQTLSYTRITPPNNGVVSINPTTGAYAYNPLALFTGVDSFQYKICDNGAPSLCDTAWAFVTVAAPIGSPNVNPIANDDNSSTTAGTPVTVNVKANDFDLNPNTILGTPTVVGTPVGGTPSVNPDGTVTFTPNPGFTGVATFKYQVCDNGIPSLCDTATVTIDVATPTNFVNVAPTAINDATTTPINTSVAGNAKTNDLDLNVGQTLTYATTPVINPLNGGIVLQADGTYIYTPTTGFVGLDSAQYRVCDNGSPVLCATAWIVVEVTPLGVNTNMPPVATKDNAATTAGIPVTINVKGNDYDPNVGQTLSKPTIVTPSPNGTATVNPDGTVKFTPTPGFTGTTTFTYQVCDDGFSMACNTAVVTVVIAPTPTPLNNNLAPVAVDDANQTLKNTVVNGTAAANDNDPNAGQTLTYSLLTNANNGVVSLNANGTYTYTPTTGFTGTDQFQYKICDNGSPTMCDTATVYFTIYDFPCVTMNLKILLEGSLKNSPTAGIMRTTLNERGLLPGQTPIGQFAVATPAGHPFAGAPWNLVDTTGQTMTTYDADVTDWVLVSLRTNNTSAASILRVPALLMKDGTVRFVNTCFNIPNGSYYVVIEHRNHMGAMSPSMVAIVNSVLNFDFTTGNSLASVNVNDPPAFGQKLVGTKWAMYSGDGKKNTTVTNYDINFNDSQLWKVESGIFDQYRYGDFDMNADVNFQDQVLWKLNNGRYSVVPH